MPHRLPNPVSVKPGRILERRPQWKMDLTQHVSTLRHSWESPTRGVLGDVSSLCCSSLPIFCGKRRIGNALSNLVCATWRHLFPDRRSFGKQRLNTSFAKGFAELAPFQLNQESNLGRTLQADWRLCVCVCVFWVVISICFVQQLIVDLTEFAGCAVGRQLLAGMCC